MRLVLEVELHGLGRCGTRDCFAPALATTAPTTATAATTPTAFATGSRSIRSPGTLVAHVHRGGAFLSFGLFADVPCQRGGCRHGDDRCRGLCVRRDRGGDGRLDGRRANAATGIVAITTTRRAVATASGALRRCGGCDRSRSLAGRRLACRLVAIALCVTIAAGTVRIAVTIPRTIRPTTIPVAARTIPIAVPIPVPAATTAARVRSGARALLLGVGFGTRCCRGRGHGIAEQPQLQAREHAEPRTLRHHDHGRCGRCDRRRFGAGHDRCRRGRQEGRNGGGLLGRFLLARPGRIGHLGRCRHLVADPAVLGLLDVLVAQATDRVLRGFDVEVRDDDEIDVALVLQRAQPLALLVDEVGGHVHGDFGDDLGRLVLAGFLADQAQDGQRHGFDRADAADALAARADGVARVAERRPQALARHLEQAETGQAADLDAGAVHLHGIAQPVLDGPLVLRLFHVDEVDDDQAADVADAQLARDLVRGFQVGVGGRRLDVRAARGARGVDVDRHQRLGVIDDDGPARGKLDLVRVCGLDLDLDLEAGEQRDVVRIHLEAALALVGHEALHVFLGDAEGVRLVDEYFADVLGEVVAQGACHRIALAVNQEGRGARQHGADDLVPLHLEVVEVPLQFFDRPADAGGAHDGAHAIGNAQRIHDLAHLVPVLALDAATDAARARVVRHEHQEAPGERDVRGQGGALVAAFFLLDLDDDVLAFLEHFTHVDARALRLLQEILARDFLERQEAVTLRAVIDEAGFKRGLDARDAALVDVGLFLFA